MAKAKKKGGGHRRPRSSNPKKGKTHHRRRRNPGTVMDRAVKLLGGAAVALATGVAVTVATAKIDPGNPLSLYGIPAATFGLGAAVAGKHPTVGVGMALGSLSPFVIPVSSKVLTAGIPSANANQTAAGLGWAMRRMRGARMGAIDMGAIDMGNYRYA